MSDHLHPEDETALGLWTGWLQWLNHEPTDEELCYQVRTSRTCHRFAWEMFIARNPSVDHFIKIAQETFKYQEPCFSHIVSHARSKGDLMFVISRSTHTLFPACKKLVSTYPVKRNELMQAFKRLAPLDANRLVYHILTGPIKPNRQILYSIRKSLSEQCHAFLTEAEVGAFEQISKSPRENLRVQAAGKFIREFPSKTNTLRVFELLKNDRTAPWLRLIGKKYVTKNGVIKWVPLCGFVPDTITPELYETLDLLVRLDGTMRPLSLLLRQTFGGRKLAATLLLTRINLDIGHLCLLVRYAPKRQRLIAAIRLLHSKKSRIMHLARIWNRVESLRGGVEKRLLKMRLTEKRAEEIRRYSPPLLKELRKKLAAREAKTKT